MGILTKTKISSLLKVKTTTTTTTTKSTISKVCGSNLTTLLIFLLGKGWAQPGDYQENEAFV